MGRILMLSDSTENSRVGQLGAQLARLSREGLPVVDGFVLPIGFDLADGLSNEILRNFDHMRRRINQKQNIEEDVYAVLRVSFNNNDFENETLRDVGRNELIDAVRYMKKNSQRRGKDPALIIQHDIDAEASGTVHSINPATRNPNEILIEANLWMNHTVLGGESEPDMILVDKNTGMTSLESEEENEICLTPEQIHQLYIIVRKMERRLKFPLSLDWAYDRGVLYILRVRRLDSERLKEYSYED